MLVESNQNLGQQTGNYPAGKLLERWVAPVLAQPASYTYQRTLIMLDSERGVIMGAKVIGEVPLDDR
jgi:hypothetical protein